MSWLGRREVSTCIPAYLPAITCWFVSAGLCLGCLFRVLLVTHHSAAFVLRVLNVDKSNIDPWGCVLCVRYIVTFRMRFLLCSRSWFIFFLRILCQGNKLSLAPTLSLIFYVNCEVIRWFYVSRWQEFRLFLLPTLDILRLAIIFFIAILVLWSNG